MTKRFLRATAATTIPAVALVLPATPATADQVRNNQWHLKALNVAAAHKISQGEGITVAVIDSGVDPHPDLRDNLLRGTDVVPGGTGDGRQDSDGHGTEVAGLIAAHGKAGGNGALGIAPKAKILPIRTSTAARPGDSVDLADGIDYAIRQHADIINISSAGSPHPRLTKAIEAALAADIVVVAGAGNRPREVVVTFPAFLDGVLAVGATDRRGNRASISVTGDKLELMAPGIDVHSTYNRGRYAKSDGTSLSTAIVSGAAALVRSRYPDLSAQEVVHRLTATATDKGPAGRDPEYGYGVLNLVAALTADVPALQPSGSPGAAPSPTATDVTALPNPDDQGNDSGAGPMVLIGILLVVVLAAIAIAIGIWLAFRRRRSIPMPGPGPAPPAHPGSYRPG